MKKNLQGAKRHFTPAEFSFKNPLFQNPILYAILPVMIQLIAFLGNYGHEYADTRHNAAWLFEDSLPFASLLSWEKKFKGEFSSIDYQTLAEWFCEAGLLKKREDGSLPIPQEVPQRIYFLKPLTYMNLSGEAISEAAHFYKIKPEEILICHDEIELPLGTLSLKWSGGLGGHNGLRSAKACLSTADFWRMRLGVGKPANGNVADYVLGSFTADEKITLSQVFVSASTLLSKVLVAKDAQRLIQEWGKKKVAPDGK